MDQQQLFETLSMFGYPVMFLMMVAEGLVATIVSAFMASLGFFDIRVVAALSVLGDVLGDLIFYSLGRIWGMRFVRRFGRHIGITESRVEAMRSYFMDHGGKTIFTVKSTTGLCWVTFVAAGIAGMPLRKFIAFSFLGGVLWSGLLVFLGYRYGLFLSQIEEFVSWVGIFATILFLLALAALTRFRNRRRDDYPGGSAGGGAR
jgi:membrane protein DedA with SNARE-associated domain